MSSVNRFFRAWTYMRRAHSVYLAFFLTQASAILIYYNMLIQKVPALQPYFPDILSFTLAFICIYFPVATVIGFLDYKRGSIRVDGVLNAQANPITMASIRSSLHAQTAFLHHVKGEEELAAAHLEKAVALLEEWLP